MDKDQQEQFAAAVERKKAEAQEASEAPDPHAPGAPEGKVKLDPTGQGEPGLTQQGSQDANSARDKNSQHGKVTADKWNQ